MSNLIDTETGTRGTISGVWSICMNEYFGTQCSGSCVCVVGG